jgi:hypothetical protein
MQDIQKGGLMITFRTLVIGAAAAAAMTTAVPAQVSTSADQIARADLAQRMNAYVGMKEAVRQTVMPLVTLQDPVEIRRRTEALAVVIRSARSKARQGDIFTPEIAQMIRRAVREGCEGEYALQIALIYEEQTEPIPAPRVNDRWPGTAPYPTMLPGVLAALPALPEGLEYRFMNSALVLLDIDANLIVDFVPEVIVITTEVRDAH